MIKARFPDAEIEIETANYNRSASLYVITHPKDPETDVFRAINLETLIGFGPHYHMVKQDDGTMEEEFSHYDEVKTLGFPRLSKEKQIETVNKFIEGLE